jgi:hypothetical protein
VISFKYAFEVHCGIEAGDTLFFFFFFKVTVKFIRRGTVWRKEREAFPIPHAENGSKDSGDILLKEKN